MRVALNKMSKPVEIDCETWRCRLFTRAAFRKVELADRLPINGHQHISISAAGWAALRATSATVSLQCRGVDITESFVERQQADAPSHEAR